MSKEEEKKTTYIMGLTCTQMLIIGKLDDNKDIEKPYALIRDPQASSGDTSVKMAVVPFLPRNMKTLKRSALISETFEIEENIISAYQQLTSPIKMATTEEITQINNNNKVIPLRKNFKNN